MKTSKTCPKCSGTEIYTDATIKKLTDCRFLPLSNSSWSVLFMDVYLCISCGYSEEYMNSNDMKDPKKMEKLKKMWKKH